MMSVSSEKLFSKFEANPPANRDSIARCQAHIGFRLPTDYVQFLLQMNGGEGFVGKNYLRAWPVEDLIKSNKDYHVDEAAPGLFLFGSNGGGEAYAFDTRSAPPPVVVAPYVGMDWDAAITIAPDFCSFLQHLYRSEDLF
jgi:hypothetical protein